VLDITADFSGGGHRGKHSESNTPHTHHTQTHKHTQHTPQPTTHHTPHTTHTRQRLAPSMMECRTPCLVGSTSVLRRVGDRR
jgi:hypothetical protein